MIATTQDIIDCYRLLLGRAPDAAGFDVYSRARLTRDELVRGFLASAEFRQRQAAMKTVAQYGVEFVVPSTERMYDAPYEPHVTACS